MEGLPASSSCELHLAPPTLSYLQASLPMVLRGFEEQATTSQHYVMAQVEEVQTLALMIAHLPLTLREAYLFSIAPCDPQDGPVAAAFLRFATAFARGRVSPLLALPCPLQPARSEAELQTLEAAHRVLDLYVWLAYRFEAFEGREVVEEHRALLAQLIDTSLRDMGLPPARYVGREGAASRDAQLAVRCVLGGAVRLVGWPSDCLPSTGMQAAKEGTRTNGGWLIVVRPAPDARQHYEHMHAAFVLLCCSPFCHSAFALLPFCDVTVLICS